MKIRSTIFLTILFLHISASFAPAGPPVSDKSGDIINPEKGTTQEITFYSSKPDRNDPFDDIGALRANGHSMALLVVYLDNYFLTDNISQDDHVMKRFLALFDKIRSSGVKVVLRFAYYETRGNKNLKEYKNKTPGDPTKCDYEEGSTKDKAIVALQPCVERVVRHISALGNILKTNSDLITVLEMGMIGNWGENSIEDGTEGEKQYGYSFLHDGGAYQKAGRENRRRIVSALMDGFPDINVAVRRPFFKYALYKECFPSPYKTGYFEDKKLLEGKPAYCYENNDNKKPSRILRIGFHHDSWLNYTYDKDSPYTKEDAAKDRLTSEADTYADDSAVTVDGVSFNMRSQRDLIEYESKYLPIGGETSGAGYGDEDAKKCEHSDSPDDKKIFPWMYEDLVTKRGRREHWSFIGNSYYRCTTDYWKKSPEKAPTWNTLRAMMGYKFRRGAELPEIKIKENSLSFDLKLKNEGWAIPFYERRARVFLVRNLKTATDFKSVDSLEIPLKTPVDLHNIYTDKTEAMTPKDPSLPAEFYQPVKYVYYLSLNFPDRSKSLWSDPRYSIKLEPLTTEWETGHYWWVDEITLKTEDGDIAGANLFLIGPG